MKGRIEVSPRGDRLGRWALVGVAVFAFLICGFAWGESAISVGFNPFDLQVSEKTEQLESPSEDVRAGAAEALGFLRAYDAADALAELLDDESAVVRRQAVMSLAWCGGRKQVSVLLGALEDDDWVVRQGAWVSLTNLTGMEFGYDALAGTDVRKGQVEHWRKWWDGIGDNQLPTEVMELLITDELRMVVNFALGRKVSVSSTYKGPGSVLTDGAKRGIFWQTKNVSFPQECTIDLGGLKKIGCVVVHQYGRGFCMSRYSVSVSMDGRNFYPVFQQNELSNPELVITFDSCEAKFVRVTSFATERALYPTTFYEVEVFAKAPEPKDEADLLDRIRGVRAAGALGGEVAGDLLVSNLRPYLTGECDDSYERFMVQSAIRSLGRIGDVRCREILIGFLDNPLWARYAADALGDCPSDKVCAALLKAYPLYARGIDRSNPKKVPSDDVPKLEPADRMYETPYAIAVALSRMLFDDAENLAKLRDIVPILVANIPSDFDGAMLYEPEAYQLVTAYLVEKAGMRRMVCDAAFDVLGVGYRDYDSNVYPVLFKAAKASPGDIPFGGVWLSTFAKDRADVPILIRLLEHENGWVRINAAKALMFIGDKRAVEPIVKILAESKAEAEFGFFGGFLFTKTAKQGHDEYEAKPPRWRVAYVRALGKFGAIEYVGLLVKILNDQKNVVEVQHAAAVVLDELGTEEAVEALKVARESHPFYSVRLVASEALWRRGKVTEEFGVPVTDAEGVTCEDFAGLGEDEIPGFVFIKGDNSMPNDFQIDIWRQAYSTTDSGPTYRLGDNLYVRDAGGKVRQLTHFKDGYVADCEVSWDGDKVIFARRGGEDDPWWHVYEINVDGSSLRQITAGPYHDVGPVYLPDGRIVFSSSRIGVRDEYHGYFATGLTVMNADGSDIHCIGFNVGRDNEPSILPDGRILFSRLELFYSRLKTEMTVHAVFPDGTKDVTLYGPERRKFWRQVSIDSKEKWWGEVPSRHRVLRLTQPHYLGDGQIVCATTAGLTLIGPGKERETVLGRDRNMAVTSPFPLDEKRILCAATVREFDRKKVDLGIYIADAKTGKLELVYNDPSCADFEARPIIARQRPIMLSQNERSNSYTGRFFCHSAVTSRDRRVTQMGKFVRVIEGMPAMARHHTHRSNKGEAWKNHTGTIGRILGTVPLRADGSFYVEVPADRLLHVQVLDSDRRVVGNQQIWMYARPGETRSCVGCHEKPDTTAKLAGFTPTARQEPVPCLPTGGEFTYRAKMWNKGELPDEGDERTRTVHAVNLIGRY